MKSPVGIDISCLTLDYHFYNKNEHSEKGTINNVTEDIHCFLNLHDSKKVFFVIEPTGTYSDKLLELAHAKGFEIRLADPKKSSRYMEVMGILHKTDENAAIALTLMGRNKELKLPRFNPQTENMKQRKQIQMTLNAMTKQCNMLSNQIHAMEQRLKPSQLALDALKASLEALQEQKQKLEKELQQLSDEEITEFTKYATSVTGIGPKSADLIMLFTNGLKYFDKKTQLSKFVGTVPSSHRSGTSINKKGKITKSGPSILRACLYNAAKSAKRFNYACKALYERLRSNGKPHKVAMIAVINKLLHQVFAVVKSKTQFDNELYLKNNTK